MNLGGVLLDVGSQHGVTVRIRYRNHRGEVAVRRIMPKQLRFDATKWHPEPQWLVVAFDCDRGADRSFALADVLEVLS